MPVSNEWEEPVEDDLIQPEDKGRVTTSTRPPSSEQEAPSHTERKKSGLGIASFVISISGYLFLTIGFYYPVKGFSVYAFAMVMFSGAPGGAALYMGIFGIGFLIAELVALGLGIGGLRQKETEKNLATLGTVFSSVALVVLVLLIGLSM